MRYTFFLYKCLIFSDNARVCSACCIKVVLFALKIAGYFAVPSFVFTLQ